jgi:hypothetical protein
VKSIEQQLSVLLDWICLRWGFCIPVEDRVRLTKSSRLEAHGFALAVLRADGFDEPENEKKWMKLLSERFVEHFGTAIVSSEEGSEQSREQI